MTKMKLKIEEQKKELDKTQKDFEVRIKDTSTIPFLDENYSKLIKYSY